MESTREEWRKSCVPTISLQTQDVVIVEGEKMHLKVPYRAIPKPSMIWKKDETELKTGDRLTLTCELNNVHLELLKCKHEDAGVYTVTLENSLGSATGTVNVKVIGIEFDISVKNGVLIKAGETLRIPAYVVGRPIPEVKWTKDDAEPDKERVVIETVGKCSTLSIKNALRTDHGKYEITGTNPSGTKSAFIKVDVMGM
uniref:Ig-like domain-containing protein n=1 Tax=Pygocentrus nattereri TaxID=42514 RepID=A0AAR2L666_PYGNA